MQVSVLFLKIFRYISYYCIQNRIFNPRFMTLRFELRGAIKILIEVYIVLQKFRKMNFLCHFLNKVDFLALIVFLRGRS